MKTHKEITVIIVIVFTLVAFVSGYYAGKELKDDCELEENLENVIEHSTGIQIDLSQDTPDKDIQKGNACYQSN